MLSFQTWDREALKPQINVAVVLDMFFTCSLFNFAISQMCLDFLFIYCEYCVHVCKQTITVEFFGIVC